MNTGLRWLDDKYEELSRRWQPEERTIYDVSVLVNAEESNISTGTIVEESA